MMKLPKFDYATDMAVSQRKSSGDPLSISVRYPKYKRSPGAYGLVTYSMTSEVAERAGFMPHDLVNAKVVGDDRIRLEVHSKGRKLTPATNKDNARLRVTHKMLANPFAKALENVVLTNLRFGPQSVEFKVVGQDDAS